MTVFRIPALSELGLQIIHEHLLTYRRVVKELRDDTVHDSGRDRARFL